MMMSMEGERTVEPLIATPFQEASGDLSPDGNWLAYRSNASGQNEVYVRPFPDVNSGRWQVSTQGGVAPLWAPDGRELFYLAPGGQMMAVTVQTDAIFAAGTPEVLFAGVYFFLGENEPVRRSRDRPYDIAPDGQRFLMIKEAEPDEAATPTSIVVVQNWLQELIERVPLP